MKDAKIFGTDGIRGQVGEFPLDDKSIFRLGKAIASVTGKETGNKPGRFLLGCDTRASGPDIEGLLAAGIKGQHFHASPPPSIHTLGALPTPGLSYLTRIAGYDYGIMITASHNPYTDNGIKIFGGGGEKIPNEMEQRIETAFYELEQESAAPVAVAPAPSGVKQRYCDFLISHGRELGEFGLHVVLDCANGAAYEIAPSVFRALGIKTTLLHARPDGKNINLDCGSTHPRELLETVAALGADLGVAFDGDADRVLLADGRGRLLDGDYTLLFLARYFLEAREDFNRKVVGTVMGNLALEKALQELGIAYTRTGVGDRQVAAEMKASGAVLGGEQSGHTIISCFQPSGDGILTALYVLRALRALDISPHSAGDQLTLFPQELRGFRVKEKPVISEWSELQDMIREFERNYGEDSRVLIRYSGTEPKIRLMMESKRSGVIEEYMTKFERFIHGAIGAD